jgi:hypothetical protein
MNSRFQQPTILDSYPAKVSVQDVKYGADKKKKSKREA